MSLESFEDGVFAGMLEVTRNEGFCTLEFFLQFETLRFLFSFLAKYREYHERHFHKGRIRKTC